MRHTALRQIGDQLLPAIAYGDAAGLPVETQSHAKIKERYGRIDRLLPAHENPFYIGEYDAGTWSDDTQLSLVVARSLARVGAVELRDIANLHVDAYHETPQIVRPNKQIVKRGWGGSTTRSVERYMRGVSLEDCGEPQGMGNGVIMKMAPLAFWHIARETALDAVYDDCDKLTSFTHANATAKVATRLHHDVLRYLLTEDYDQEEFVHRIVASARHHEDALRDTSRDVSSELMFLNEHFLFDTDTILNNTDGKGFFVAQTLAMAYGAFIAHDGKFTESVYEAVNLGGDTDSTASIVAAMSVMRGGEFEVPDDFTDTQHYPDLVSASSKLSEVALRSIQ